MKVAASVVDAIGETPLIRLNRASAATGCEIWGKAEFMNPGQSVKDRAALSIIRDAERRGALRPGGLIVEGTAGNTGIGLAMVASALGYRTAIVIPRNQSQEKKDTLRLLVTVQELDELLSVFIWNYHGTPHSSHGGHTPLSVMRRQVLVEVDPAPYSNPDNYVHVSQRLAEARNATEPNGAVWANQFDNVANRRAHYETTGPEIWADTQGKITHFVSAMGTTGTITGVSRFLKEMNPAVRIIGAQPAEGSRIPGIRKWPQEYLPKIYNPLAVDELVYVTQPDAEEMCRRLAREEGIFGGISAAGACWVAQQIALRERDATVVFVVCDRGDRYLSTGVFPA